jgi:uncharacterized protein YdcH (DUF465 family)
MSPNVAIVSATAALLTLVLAIFAASWLNQRYIGKLLEEFGKRFDARFEAVLAEMRRLDQRIDSVEHRLDQRIESVERRLERIERQLEAIFKPSPRA